MYGFKLVGAVDKKSSSSFLDDTPIFRTNYTCTGVVHCEYLDNKIKEMHHCEVTEEMLKTVEEIRARSGKNTKEDEANRSVIYFDFFYLSYSTNYNSFYFSELKRFDNGACGVYSSPICQPRLVQEAQEVNYTLNISPIYSKYILNLLDHFWRGTMVYRLLSSKSLRLWPFDTSIAI